MYKSKIIGGSKRGGVLKIVSNADIRPTQSRIKDSIFNILNHNFKDAIKSQNVLDLFAGSGTLGMECLSYGAKQVYFVDKLDESIKVIKQNIQKFSFENNAKILKSDSIKLRISPPITFKLVILDPPYKDISLLNRSIANLIKQEYVNKDTIFLLETHKKNPDEIKGLKLIYKKEKGFKKILIYTLLN